MTATLTRKLMKPKYELRPYQRQGADFVKTTLKDGVPCRRKDGTMSTSRLIFPDGNEGAGLFADLGTGKTAMSITALSELFAEKFLKRCLVLGPLRVIHNVWPDELETWAPHLKYNILHGKTIPAWRTQIELQSCDSVHKLVEHAGRWDMVIVDESRNFASWTSRRMKSLRKLLPSIPLRLCLTAAPTPETEADLHAQSFIMDDGEALGKNVTIFRAKYMERGGWMGRQFKLRSECKGTILDAIAPRVIRIDAKSNVDLPDLIENDVWVTLPSNCRSEYNRLKRELALELDRQDGPKNIMVGQAGALYNKLKQYANGQVYCGAGEPDDLRTSEIVHDEKINALTEMLEDLYERPAIILYQYVHDKTRILEKLGKSGVAVIDGNTSSAEGTKIIGQWNGRKIKYLVSHIRCLSHGLNLQKGGADMILYGLTDSCDSYIQARGRLHRPGQTEEQVRIHRILTRDTVEVLQLERLSGKIKGQEDFLDALKAHVRKN